MTERTGQEELVQDEKSMIKARLDQMNISYHPNTGLEKLKTILKNALTGDDEPVEEDVEDAPKTMTLGQRKVAARKKAMKLRRVIVTCMNPNKKEWEGEILSASNSMVGSVKKYVPFGVEYHVPEILYKMIKRRKFQTFFTKKGKLGVDIRVGKLIPEFSVQDLPPLTQEELEELAATQRAANNID